MNSTVVGSQTLGGLGVTFLAIASFLLIREFSVPFGYTAAVVLIGWACVLPRLNQKGRTIGALAFIVFGLSTPIFFLVADRQPHVIIGIGGFCGGAAILIHRTRAVWQAFDANAPERKWETIESITLWAALTVSCLALAWSLYFWFLSSLGDAFLARRLVFTVALVAAGLILVLRGQQTPLPFIGMAGLCVLGTGVTKALLYDTTHLTGVLRIAVFGACGLLLVVGARAVGKHEGDA